MAATPIFNFRWPTGRRERMRALAQARGLTLTEALLEAEDLWCRREERRETSTTR